jgi:pimeloyl-ACP methyl ester carboxylesterase
VGLVGWSDGEPRGKDDQETVEQLAPHFQVFAVDLPGFGRSDKPSRVLHIGERAYALAA